MSKVLANNTENLPYLSNQERLKAYTLITDGVSHVWSKGKLQRDKALAIIEPLIALTEKDPVFLAHLNSYALLRTANKDLKIFTTLANSLSSANGTPFSPRSKYTKPNLRIISAAALHMMDPIMADNLLLMFRTKFAVPNYLNNAQHFPSLLQDAFRKYLLFREKNVNILKGARAAGMAPTIRRMYRRVHLGPSDEAASVLKWQQRGKNIQFDKSPVDFTGLTDLQIAEKIRRKNLPILGLLGGLPRQMSPVVAVAVLEQCTGNQAVILRRTFEDAGVLKDPEVLKLYERKIKTAKTALDRAKTVSEGASEEVKKILRDARAESRKETVGNIGKVFLMIDSSGSMDDAFEIAQERGAIIAEMVKNPEENFGWGNYSGAGHILPLPKEFVEDAFRAVLFGKRATGSTDAFALYPTAREFGAEVDVHISDGGHNVGDLGVKIKKYHDAHPRRPKPKACVIVQVRTYDFTQALKKGYEDNGIPVAVVKPEALTESALVAQAVKTAIAGPVAIIDEIMSTNLLRLPDYYFTL